MRMVISEKTLSLVGSTRHRKSPPSRYRDTIAQEAATGSHVSVTDATA